MTSNEIIESGMRWLRLSPSGVKKAREAIAKLDAAIARGEQQYVLDELYKIATSASKPPAYLVSQLNSARLAR